MIAPAPAQSWRLGTGAVLGGWRVTGTLAKGGMGELYVVERVGGARERAALKILLVKKGARGPDEKMLRRFLQEADILSRIQHPNVVRFFEAGTSDGGEPFMVTELLEGATLLEVVETQGRLAVPEVLDVCAEVADGVHAGHELGVLHRDLKPANVFLTREGAVKVIDFGIAKPFEGELVAGKIAPSTEHGMIIGTWNYLSPEQLLGKKKLIDRGSDMFALATMAYELIAGVSPWADDDGLMPTRDVVGTRIVMVDPEPLTGRFHGFPDDVWHVLKTALAKAPRDRFANMAVFASRLRRARAQYLAARGMPQGGLAGLAGGAASKVTPKRGGTQRALEAVPPLESRVVSPLAPPTTPSPGAVGPKGTIPMGPQRSTPRPADAQGRPVATDPTERGPTRARVPVAPTEIDRALDVGPATAPAHPASWLHTVALIASATAVVIVGLFAMKHAGLFDRRAQAEASTATTSSPGAPTTEAAATLPTAAPTALQADRLAPSSPSSAAPVAARAGVPAQGPLPAATPAATGAAAASPPPPSATAPAKTLSTASSSTRPFFD